jgi:hypothetical protein
LLAFPQFFCFSEKSMFLYIFDMYVNKIDVSGKYLNHIWQYLVNVGHCCIWG